jgi:hypothetical protein
LKKTSGKEKPLDSVDEKSLFASQRTALTELYPLSSKEVLNRILEHDRPRQLVQELPSEDFFWLVKKVGDNDCLPILELASEEQWQYLLDLEIWSKDSLHLVQAFRWIERLQLADSERLVKWFFTEGQDLAYYFLFKSIHVEVKKEDEVYDLDQGFFTLDGLFYIRVLDDKQRDSIENLLRTMANEDLNRYHALLLGLAGVLPAEMEEEMYRLKNVRLAEHGFLPFEEALSVYSPLDPEAVSIGEPPETMRRIVLDEADRGLVPVSPLYHAMGENLLAVTVSRVTDSVLLDRIALEFTGLCNQILSADGLLVNDFDILIKTCRKASGYLNMAFERLCGADVSLAEKLLKTNSLMSVFRVGFGLALELKWEAEGWIKKSWFNGQGLEFGFWGDWWGETLAGVVENKPLLYVGLEKGEEYRDFEKLSELDDCRKLLRRLIVLDRLFGRLAGLYPFNKDTIQDSPLTFHQFLFNLWARHLLKLEPCFSGIFHTQVKEFFGLLRANEKNPPYRMAGFEEAFITDYMAYASDFEPETAVTLKDTLSLIWQEFREEHEWITTIDPDGRFTRFIRIMPFHESPAQ